MCLVVIAEDEPLLVEMLTEIFESEGLDVTAFATADDAWRYLQTAGQAPDLLFTDVRMPGAMDGLALAKQVMARWPTASIVVSSGHVPVAPGLPSASFLPKPWSFGQLTTLCRNVQARQQRAD
ncbi:response regulator [Pseudomonas sp. PLB05]|uniref:response regulator n=1 Tax=Pseudomonas sp. PLB05 TaxID=2899078 RepID=UPI001E32A27E|nr:response regulator [Pseudomonas sp. PLB05]MCD4866935.1 response regulator [Pseudomonas sp. PLB05]